jgi:two-component system, NarL family, sensor histidine kinase UhpB
VIQSIHHPTGFDMTKRRTASRLSVNSNEAEEGFRITFEEAAIGMAHVAVDGRWLRINRKLCEIVGYSREELLGKTFQDITYGADLDADLAHVQELLDGKAERYSMEKRYIRKDGSLVWINLAVSLLRDANGNPKYFISVVEDISERKRMEEALAQSHLELEAQVEQRTSALRALSNRLMQLQDEERRRIARDLHDSVGQYLTALAINLDLLSGAGSQNRQTLFSESRQLLDQCLAEVRTMSHLLHPPLLDETGFASAAQWYVEGFARRSGIEVDLRLPRIHRLPANIEIMLFRVLQETLNNIHRHSGSNKAQVSLELNENEVILEVRDFGQGIQPDRLERFRTSGTGVGVGLAGIRERVSELGGAMRITSGGSGTCIRISVPTRSEDSVANRTSAAD